MLYIRALHTSQKTRKPSERLVSNSSKNFRFPADRDLIKNWLNMLYIKITNRQDQMDFEEFQMGRHPIYSQLQGDQNINLKNCC